MNPLGKRQIRVILGTESRPRAQHRLCSLLIFKEVLCTGVPPSNRKVWVRTKEWHGSLTTLPSIISNFNLTSNLSLRDYCKLSVEVANFWSRRVLISDSNWPDTKGKPQNVGGLFLDCVQAWWFFAWKFQERNMRVQMKAVLSFKICCRKHPFVL